MDMAIVQVGVDAVPCVVAVSSEDVTPAAAAKQSAADPPEPQEESALDSRQKVGAANKLAKRGRTAVQRLGRGFSLADWLRLTERATDLAGLGGRQPCEYTLEQVRAHNTKHDAWMVVRGKIYNVSKYLPYHPGGSKMLMRGVGKDATSLFDKHHRWVSPDMLESCLVGTLKPPT